MSLDIALVIRGNTESARTEVKALTTDMEGLGRKAEATSKPVADVATALEDTGAAAAAAGEHVAGIGSAAETTGGQLTQFKGLALGAIGGFAAGLVSSGIATLLGAAGQAAIGFFGTIIDKTPQVEADLKTHKALVDQIRGAYATAKGAASDYGATSSAFLKVQAQQDVVRLQGDYSSQLSDLSTGGFWHSNSLQAGQGPANSPLGPSLEKFRADLRAGTADVIAFRTEISEIVAKLPLNDPNRTYADAIFGDIDAATKTQQSLLQSADILKGLQGDAEATATALGGSAEKFGALGAKADAINPSLTAMDTVLKSIAANAQAIPSGGYDDIGLGPHFTQSGTKTFAIGGATGEWPGIEGVCK